MKKRLLSLLLSAALLCGALPTAFAGYENFTPKTTYTDGRFSDVSSSDWFYENVRASYEYDLINGYNDGKFHPDDDLTIAQAVKLAACLNSLYSSGTADFSAASPWYQPYVDYARRNGILTRTFADYDAHASRREFAAVLAGALPRGALQPINSIADGAIPDVPASAEDADAIYQLYRAGVLTGSNGGRFKPDDTIRRSEAAAILTRMAVPSLRQKVEISTGEQPENVLSADEILEKCGPAVFKLTSYDARGNLLGMGSGVVLSANGDAVTCGHLVNGVARLVAEMADGSKREVSIYALDADSDIAHIRVVGVGLPYLETADSPSTGDIVYALGYPGGGAEKVTAGKVLDDSNGDYLVPMIETTASVVSGNSGGALIDGQGRAVAVTVSSRTGGSSSFSVPLSVLDKLQGSTAVTPAEYSRTHKPDSSRCYDNLYPVPDFGTVSGASLFATSRDRGTTCFYYALSELPDLDRQLLRYYAALGENTFYQFNESSFTSSAGYLLSVKLYETTWEGIDVLGVFVSGMQTS